MLLKFREMRNDEESFDNKSSIFKAVVAQKSKQSYFVNITVPQPKIRVKIPKVIVKTIRMRKKKNDLGGHSGLGEKTKKTNKKKKKGLGCFLSRVFVFGKSKSRDEIMPSSFKGHYSLKDFLQVEQKNKKKNILSFIKDKVKKNKFVVGTATSSGCTGVRSVGSKAVTREGISKVNIGRSMRKIATMGIGDGVKEEEGNEELCKKRILMGEKCKPLNYSGHLEYDKDGMLLPVW